MIALSEIISRVRVIINEADTADDTFSSETDASIREFVLQALPLLAANPLYLGPVSTLSASDSISFRQRPDGNYCAFISLPRDFVRLVSVRLSEWVRPVYMLYSTDSSQWHDQYLAYPGLGAGPHAPIAFLAGNTYVKAIEAHSITKPSCAYELQYIASPSVSAEDEVDLSSRYAYPLSYMAAGLFLQSVSETDAAQLAFQTANSYLHE